MIIVIASKENDINHKLVYQANILAKILKEKITLIYLIENKKILTKLDFNFKVDKIDIIINKIFGSKLSKYYSEAIYSHINTKYISFILFNNDCFNIETAESLEIKLNSVIIKNIIELKKIKNGYFITQSDQFNTIKYELPDKTYLLCNMNLKTQKTFVINKKPNITINHINNFYNCKIYNEYNLASNFKSSSLIRAKVVFSGGRGLNSISNFNKIRSLTNYYKESAVSGSRPTVELGYIDLNEQVGQTGKTLSSDFYIAFGISGAIQHLAGIKNVKNIISINTDTNAPINKFSKYIILEDAEIFLNEFLKLFKE